MVAIKTLILIVLMVITILIAFLFLNQSKDLDPSKNILENVENDIFLSQYVNSKSLNKNVSYVELCSNLTNAGKDCL